MAERRYWVAVLAAVLLLLFTVGARAVSFVPRQFSNDAQRQRYRHLIGELRCLVCQNESLAESDADLAHDLRNDVYKMVRAGKTDKQIIHFMVARYGDFVLYRPPFEPLTALLWTSPFLFGAGGVLLLLRHVRRRRHATAVVPLDARERERLRALLERQDDGVTSSGALYGAGAQGAGDNDG